MSEAFGAQLLKRIFNARGKVSTAAATSYKEQWLTASTKGQGALNSLITAGEWMKQYAFMLLVLLRRHGVEIAKLSAERAEAWKHERRQSVEMEIRMHC